MNDTGTASPETGTAGSARRSTLRLWPAIVVIVVAAAWIVRAWSADAAQRQERILDTLIASVLTFILLIVWLVFFSRLPWRTRGIVLGTIAVVGLLLVVLLRIEGITGDLRPILKWRFSADAGLAPPPVPRSAGPTLDRIPEGPGYPRFFGPNRDGVLSGPRLARDWSVERPKILWRVAVGPAWSGFAVLGAFAVTQEQLGAEEVVSCYDLGSGRLHWSHADETRHEDPLGGVGPRATPSIVDGRVYALGATGILNVLELATGEHVWSRNILDDAGVSRPTYGVSASPLVLDDLVVVMAGGPGASLIAYDRRTGEPVWRGGSDPAAYSSPTLVDLAGTPQIVVLNAEAVVGHSPDDGHVLWRFPWPGDFPQVSQPVLLPGDRLFVSTGYGVGGKLLHIVARPDAEFAVERVWESRGLKAKFTNVVSRDGTLYGLDDGVLVALDETTGKRRWKRGRYGHGQLILVNDLLVISAENGEIALVEANPEAYREAGRIEALSGRTWNSPAIAGRYLLVRNDHEAICFELPLADTNTP